jgi:hypothetical protein
MDRLPFFVQKIIYYNTTPFATLNHYMNIIQTENDMIYPFQLHSNLTILEYKIPAYMSCNHYILSGTIAKNISELFRLEKIDVKTDINRKINGLALYKTIHAPFLFLSMNQSYYQPSLNFDIKGNVSQMGKLIWYKSDMSIDYPKRKMYNYTRPTTFNSIYNENNNIPVQTISSIVTHSIYDILTRSIQKSNQEFYKLDIDFKTLYMIDGEYTAKMHFLNLQYAVYTLFYSVKDVLEKQSNNYDKYILLIDVESYRYSKEKFVTLLFWNVISSTILQKPIHLLFVRNNVTYPFDDEFTNVCYMYIFETRLISSAAWTHQHMYRRTVMALPCLLHK